MLLPPIWILDQNPARGQGPSRRGQPNLLLLLPNKPASILKIYLTTTGIVGVFFLIRMASHQEVGVYGFYLLLPGVFLAAALFDRGSGLYASALGAGLVLLILHMDDRLDPLEQDLIPTILNLIVAGGMAAVSRP
jgi:hypothetical protein